jgi:hypothetical protein
MEMLMPATITGANVYHTASVPPPPASLPSAIDLDDEEAAEAPSQQSDASSDVEVVSHQSQPLFNAFIYYSLRSCPHPPLVTKGNKSWLHRQSIPQSVLVCPMEPMCS